MSRQGLHDWVQSASALMQAVAVVFGVAFAVIQLNQWTTEREDKQREATYERLQAVTQEPIKSAFAYLRSFKPTLLLRRNIDLAGFIKNTLPIIGFAQDMQRCVDARICNRELLVEQFCPSLMLYGAIIEAAFKQEPLPDMRDSGVALVHSLILSKVCPDLIDVDQVFSIQWQRTDKK